MQSLQTSCNKSLHKLSTLLVPCLLQHVCNKLLTTCNKLDGISRQIAPTSLYSDDANEKRVEQYCYTMTVTDLLEQSCNKYDNINKVVCYKFLTACSKLVVNLKQVVQTQIVGGLFADSLQVVRFCEQLALTLTGLDD